MSVTITFTGTPSQINADMRAMLNMERGSAATLPILTDAIAPIELAARPEEAGAHVSNGKSDVNDFDLNVPAPGEVPATTKRTRRTKAEIEAEKAAKAKPVETAAPSQGQASSGTTGQAIGGTIGKEAVHQALQQVNVAVGLPKSREILQSFGANRISEIKEDQYKAFVDKCNEAVTLS